MAGREGAVASKIHLDLFKFASLKKTVEMYSSLDGSDRFFNADGLFAFGTRFFLVEMKSFRYNIGDETKKTSACKLCMNLHKDIHMQNLHDKGHMIAWGEKSFFKLNFKIGAYRYNVCNNAILKNCKLLQDVKVSEPFQNDKIFFEKLEKEIYGLDSEMLVEYLKFLLGKRIPKSHSGGDFPLSIFGVSFSGVNYGIREYNFRNYSSFAEWADIVMTAVDPTFSTRLKHNTTGVFPSAKDARQEAIPTTAPRLLPSTKK